MTRDVFIREIRQSESMLYHVAKSILKNDSDCADAVQETLLKAYEKLHTLKQDQFFRTWITRILINECNGILRKKKHVISYEEYMENAGASEPKKVSAKYCYAAHESRLHQNDRCKRFTLCLVLTVRFRSLAPWGKLFQLFI